MPAPSLRPSGVPLEPKCIYFLYARSGGGGVVKAFTKEEKKVYVGTCNACAPDLPAYLPHPTQDWNV